MKLNGNTNDTQLYFYASFWKIINRLEENIMKKLLSKFDLFVSFLTFELISVPEFSFSIRYLVY